MPLSPAPTRTSPVTATLAADRLGVAAVVFFVMSAATPLTVVAGVITTGYATTGLTGIPLAFVLVGLLLGLFSVGYVTMARHTANAGAFYSYIAQGIGRPAGVGAAWVALLAYNALQVGLYGAIGAAAQPLLHQWFGVTPPWWCIALIAWAITAGLGLRRIDVNGKVLAVLLLAEVAIIAIYSLSSLASPADGRIALDTLAPGNLFGPGIGAVLVLAVLGFVGFEAAVVFSEESRDPHRTVRTATYLSVALIAGLYALSAWAMTVATGPGRIVEVSRNEGTEVIFNLAAANLGRTMVDIGHALFVTSILAAMIAFHNTTARYMFALGRERVLPATLGRASRRSGAPRAASLWQSGIGLTVIVTFAIAGWDPLIQLFFWAGTSGGLGILFLITATSVAVIAFFNQHPHGETAWRRLVAPASAAIALGIVVCLAVANFAALLGVPGNHPLAIAVPIGYVVAAVLGAAWGLILQRARPDVYAAIGLGARSTTATSPLTQADDYTRVGRETWR
ncbi:APC family permease [Solwaraspora sp. WMMD406]|uniref:APC family permease n=1 Tax=Solwaraspora sp. WMMD406 TaxID=3016095 RepID=UPI002416CA5F|nr:APC family permease [Solwaraspora sp. WMMD406]MDG4768550.1 APC family permease [Solwaraspora sp. WMMD406]